MKKVLSGLVATACLLGPAFAQRQGAPPPAGIGAVNAKPQEPEFEPVADEKRTGKELRRDCREKAKADRLSGPAVRKAVMDCVIKARPDLAIREQCRAQGRTQGLKQPELRRFVQTCVLSKGGQ